MKNLDIALSYLEHGFSIIPLWPHSKEPHWRLLPDRIEDGHKVINPATGRPSKTWAEYQKRYAQRREVESWFQFDPYLGIGLLTGWLSGVIALDIDGPAGYRWVDEHGTLPVTPTNSTRRGEHALFKHPGFTVRNFTHKLPDLDLRGDGGYIAVAPTIHPSGWKYAWSISIDQPLAPMPQWLLDVVNRPRTTAAKPLLTSQAPTGASIWANAALQAEANLVYQAPAGQQNNALNRAAFKLGQLIPTGLIARCTIERTLFDAAAALTARDGEMATLRTIRSGIDAGMNNPRRR